MESSNSGKTRRQPPCFIEEDDELASLAGVEAGFGGSHNQFLSRPICAYGMTRRSSLRNMSSMVSCSSYSSPRFGGGKRSFYYDARYGDLQPHFLDSCFLCKKPLGGNRDIFMYRGDTPFCSEECRQEQIEMDESKERNWNLSSSMKALRKKEQRESTSPTTKSQDCSSRTGTVAAA